MELDTTNIRDEVIIYDATTQLTAIANMLPPLNFVGSDRCCALHTDKVATKISDTVVIAFMLSVYGVWRTAITINDMVMVAAVT